MEERSIGWLFFSIGRHIGRLGKANRDKFAIGKGKGGFLILKYVLENPGISQNELCEKIGIEKTTMAKSIKKLIEGKFIYKKRSKYDRRYFCIFPGELASEMQREIYEDFKYHSRVIQKGFSKKETEQLLSLLNRLYRNLDEEISRLTNK